MFATRLAMEFRKSFSRDVVVDIVCFRRLGHNEQDTPGLTQPLMYKKINVHPGTRQVYADKLALQGVVSPEEAKEMVAAYRRSLESGIPPRQTALIEGKNPYAVDWSLLQRKLDRRCQDLCSFGRIEASYRASLRPFRKTSNSIRSFRRSLPTVV